MELSNDTVWLEPYKINVPFSQIIDERNNYEYLDLIYCIQMCTCYWISQSSCNSY